MKNPNNLDPSKPKDLAARRLFTGEDLRTTRPHGLSESTPVREFAAASSNNLLAGQLDSGLVTGKSFALTETNPNIGRSPLRAPLVFGSLGQTPDTPTPTQRSAARNSARANALRNMIFVTPVSPRVTAPPNIHISHKKEKSAARSPFGLKLQKQMEEEAEKENPVMDG